GLGAHERPGKRAQRRRFTLAGRRHRRHAATETAGRPRRSCAPGEGSRLIIVFREVLEAALIVGIVMAASHGLAGRGRWIPGGVAAGVAGAVLVAAFAGKIAAAASGMGQELLNAAILLLAVGMLGWHNVWMTRHGRTLAATVRSIGDGV